MYENIILVPYRNRESHLNYFVKNISPLIEKFLPNSKILIIEQNDEKLFNRGAILNVGFKEYKYNTKYYITCDVDTYPTEKCIKEIFNKEIKDKSILAIFTFINTLGGTIKIKNECIYEINGFPNDIWGWGAEDDALQRRSEFFGYKKIQIFHSSALDRNYFSRFHDIDDRNKSNFRKNYIKYNDNFLKLNKEQKKELIFQSGLNNLKYEILERENLTNNTEKIKVKLL